MNRRFKSIIASLLLFTLMPMSITPASAMTPSKPTMLYGSDANDAQMPQDSSAIIEKQVITFDLNDFPNVNDVESINGYGGSVQSEYIIYNPTDEEISLQIAFPLTSLPSYAENGINNYEMEKYSITVDGKTVNTTTRHVSNYIVDPYNRFMSLVQDEYIDNEFCGPDTTVTKYTFKQTYSEKSYGYVGFDIHESETNKSCIYFSDQSWSCEMPGGRTRIFALAGEGECTYEIYVFGNDLNHTPSLKIYESYSVEDTEEIGSNIELVGKENITFSDYVFEDYDPDIGISQIDWFNIAATELSHILENKLGIISFYSIKNGLYGNLVGGLVYEITIGPGQKVTNVIKAPIYPSVETKYDPYTYDYSYNLHYYNAEMYIGNIDVNINTTYYLIEGYQDVYEKTDYGYSISVPLKEVLSEQVSSTRGGFMFTLCEVENPEENKTELSLVTKILIAVFILLIIIIVLIVELVKLIIKGVKFVINKIKNN